ncbi:tol-pal system YbgF family protein [Streptomyces sp. DH37]|uniref:tetratricopeptide repeat protein n=1 Tax=Streptomyces sp. DH37 TaxID=3040122 RepID=UPI002441D023|nr:hypothetical protein [Streptomyces sp. DH37]MDG9703834.1 hypothetical protein [Streptomyces sp. DH37]
MERRSLVTSAAYSVAAAALPLGAVQDLAGRVATARHRGVAGAAEVAAVQDMTAMFVQLDERHGGQHGRSAVAQYLRSDVADLCSGSFRTPRDRQAMLLAAASLAYLLAWKAFDAGEHGLCQRYYLQCYQLTRAAESEPHQAFILRGMAHHGLDTGHPDHCVDLADAALARARGHVDPATEALMMICRARTLAADGRATEAVTEADRAAELAMRADDAERVPHWSALWGPSQATIASHTARIHITLRDYSSAERYYARAARTYGRSTEHARVAGLVKFDLGRVQLRQGHVERACATWSEALDVLQGVRSQRATKAVTGVRKQLRMFAGRGVRAAADLDERARSWQLTHR